MPIVQKYSQETYPYWFKSKTTDSDGNVLQDYPQTQIYENVVYSGITKEVDSRRWKDLIRNGLNATTALTANEDKLEVSPLVFTGTTSFDEPTTPSRFHEWSEAYIDLGIPSQGDPTDGLQSAENQAATNFYSNLQAEETRFKGLVFAGELRESLSLIRNPARALRNGISDYLNAIKKGGVRYKQKRARQQYVADTWLEYAFGWSPLINDIDTSIDAFYGSRLVHPIFKMVRGRGQSKGGLSNTQVRYNVGLGYLDYYRKTEITYDVKFYTVYRYSGSGDSNTHNYGIRLNEVVPTLWELIPYSFLVDYFTNIGNILESWSYGVGFVGWCSKGTKVQATTELTGSSYTLFESGQGVNYSGSCSPGIYRATSKTIARFPDVGAPSVGFQLKLPGNWSQWINIAALGASHRSARQHLAL